MRRPYPRSRGSSRPSGAQGTACSPPADARPAARRRRYSAAKTLRIRTAKDVLRGAAAGSRVVIYTAESCWYCDAAKTLLDERDIPYEEVLLSRTALGRARLLALTRRMTFPQIVMDGRRVGGYKELAAADRAGRLTPYAIQEIGQDA